jgi:hypothetical protein
MSITRVPWETPKLLSLDSGSEAQANKIQWFNECDPWASCDPGEGAPGHGDEDPIGPS